MWYIFSFAVPVMKTLQSLARDRDPGPIDSTVANFSAMLFVPPTLLLVTTATTPNSMSMRNREQRDMNMEGADNQDTESDPYTLESVRSVLIMLSATNRSVHNTATATTTATASTDHFSVPKPMASSSARRCKLFLAALGVARSADALLLSQALINTLVGNIT